MATTITVREALVHSGINVFDGDDITADVAAQVDMILPILTGAQRQGDIGVWPVATRPGIEGPGPEVTSGIDLVRSASSNNNHILDRAPGSGPIYFRPADPRSGDLLAIGTLTVPEGSVATIVHTEEHGALGIGPGRYELTGKREQVAEARRVAD